MNKAGFVSFLATKNDCSKVEAERALNMVIDGVSEVLADGNNLVFVGFGSFAVQRRAAREGVNPKTHQKMQIPAYNQPVFKAGKGLKDAVNK